MLNIKSVSQIVSEICPRQVSEICPRQVPPGDKIVNNFSLSSKESICAKYQVSSSNSL